MMRASAELRDSLYLMSAYNPVYFIFCFLRKHEIQCFVNVFLLTFLVSFPKIQTYLRLDSKNGMYENA